MTAIRFRGTSSKTRSDLDAGPPLEDEEADLIAMYHLLPEEQQEDILTSFISNIESASNGRKLYFTGLSQRQLRNKKRHGRGR